MSFKDCGCMINKIALFILNPILKNNLNKINYRKIKTEVKWVFYTRVRAHIHTHTQTDIYIYIYIYIYMPKDAQKIPKVPLCYGNR